MRYLFRILSSHSRPHHHLIPTSTTALMVPHSSRATQAFNYRCSTPPRHEPHIADCSRCNTINMRLLGTSVATLPLISAQSMISSFPTIYEKKSKRSLPQRFRLYQVRILECSRLKANLLICSRLTTPQPHRKLSFTSAARH